MSAPFRKSTWDEGLDVFEIAIGNYFVYSEPLWLGCDRFNGLQSRWRGPTPIPTVTDYLDQWAHFKRLRIAWLVFLVLEMSPFDRWVQPFLHSLFPSLSDSVIGIGPTFLILVGLAFTGRDLFQWKCPRCAKPFAGGRKTMDSVKTTLDWLILPKKCISCGLPKYSTDPSSEGVVPPSF